MKHYDAIVIGCGGLGSSALYWLSRELEGSVLGIERFGLGHARGASHRTASRSATPSGRMPTSSPTLTTATR